MTNKQLSESLINYMIENHVRFDHENKLVFMTERPPSKVDDFVELFLSDLEKEVAGMMNDLDDKNKDLGDFKWQNDQKPIIKLSYDTFMAGGNADDEKIWFQLGYDTALQFSGKEKGRGEAGFDFNCGKCGKGFNSLSSLGWHHSENCLPTPTDADGLAMAYVGEEAGDKDQEWYTRETYSQKDMNEAKHNAYISGASANSGEAMVFAEWIEYQGFERSNDHGLWSNVTKEDLFPMGETAKIKWYTTSELYQLFKNNK